MDARCVKFWEDGQALVQAAAADPQRLPQTTGKMFKELRTLSRFLQRNQSQRFSDNAQQKCIDAIGMYVTLSKQSHAAAAKPGDVLQLAEETFKVVKDGLAMPFNVVGTKQKKRLFKWYNELIAIVGGDPDGALQIEGLDGDAAVVPRVQWSVLDMDADGYLSLLNDETGETCETFQVVKKSAEFKQIKMALEKADVSVITVDDEVVEVTVAADE